MTKAEIISYVSNNLKKIDKTNKYHDVVLEKAITLAFNQGYSEIYDQDPRLLDNYTTVYGGSGTPISVASHPNTSIYEATLPGPYVPFRDKNSGVRKVVSFAANAPKCYPITRHEFDIIANTLVGEMNNSNDPRIYYVVRGGVLQFYGINAYAASGVMIDMVIPFDQYSSTDQVIIPFAKDMQLVGVVIEALRTMPGVDLTDNNADTE